MGSAAEWIAPAATMIAALMTAANLGARVTGWGFVIFTIGSSAWVFVGLNNDQGNLVASNGFLTLVNAIGVWRWLGRQSRYEAVGADAEAAGRSPLRASVFALSGVAGRKIVGAGDTVLAEAVEAIMDCRTGTIIHVVARVGGVAGVGETLVAVPREKLVFGHEAIATTLTAEAIADLPLADRGEWHELLKHDPAGHSVPQAG